MLFLNENYALFDSWAYFAVRSVKQNGEGNGGENKVILCGKECFTWIHMHIFDRYICICEPHGAGMDIRKCICRCERLVYRRARSTFLC